jgi:hypothetical protein
MIPDLIIGLVVAVLRAVIGIVPPWSPDVAAFTEAGEQVGGLGGLLADYFPVTVLMVTLSAVLGFKVLLTAWHGAVFIYDRIPFKAT